MYLSLLLYVFLGIITSVAARPTVYFVRHGEKPKNGANGLSAEGLERAQCLRHVFGADSGYNIDYIVAQKPKKNGKRSRPHDTMVPLARDLGLGIDISCQRNDYRCVKDIVESYEGDGNILICWEHRRMSHIIEELGNDEPPIYPDNRFDIIWTDPSPYNAIAWETSEGCPGLDQPWHQVEI